MALLSFFEFTPPNQLTTLRVLLSPVFVILFASDDPTTKLWSLIVFFVAALTDWYDGWTARKWGFVSRWGHFYDPLADKVLTSCALFAFARVGLAQYWMVWIIIARDLVITLLRSYAEYKDRPVVTTFSAKVKTFAQMTLIFYIIIFYCARTTSGWWSRYQPYYDILMNQQFLDIAMLLITGITVWTGVTYIHDNRKTIADLFSRRNNAPESD